MESRCSLCLLLGSCCFLVCMNGMKNLIFLWNSWNFWTDSQGGVRISEQFNCLSQWKCGAMKLQIAAEPTIKWVWGFDFREFFFLLFWLMCDRCSDLITQSVAPINAPSIVEACGVHLCLNNLCSQWQWQTTQIISLSSTSAFNYRGSELEHHFHNADAWLRWIEPPDDGIDPSALPFSWILQEVQGQQYF